MEVFTHKMLLNKLINETEILVIQFGSESCGPCRSIRMKLELWEGQYPAARCVYVPTEDFPQIAAQSGIFTVPAILVYVQGRLSIQESGCFSLERILSKTETYHHMIND